MRPILTTLAMASLSLAVISCSPDEDPKAEKEVLLQPKVVVYNTGDNVLDQNIFSRVVYRDSFQYENKKVVYNLRNRTSGVDQLFEYTYIGDTTVAFRNQNSDRFSVQYPVESWKEYMEFTTFAIYAFLVTESVENQISITRYEWDDVLPQATDIESLGYVRYNLVITLDEKKENIVGISAFNVAENGDFELICEITDFKYTEYQNPLRGIRRELPYFNNTPTSNHQAIENFSTLLPAEYTVQNYWTDSNITYSFKYVFDEKDRMIKSLVNVSGSVFVPDVESITY